MGIKIINCELWARKARPQSYAYSKPGKNSPWSSRNMGVLGTIIFVYIVVHMQNFWYKYKFGESPYMTTEDGSAPLLQDGTAVPGGEVVGENVMLAGENMGVVMGDLHSIVMESFTQPILVLFYVLAMAAMAFHLMHGFQSAFQSIGLRNKKYTPIITKVGYAFAIVVPLLFAIIPVYLFVVAG